MEVEQVVVRLVADTSQYFASLDYAGARLLGYTAGLAAGIAKHGIQMAATFEKNSVAVKTMVGDVQEGARLIEDITKLAIDTPFSSDQLVEVTKQLKSFGFQSADIIDTLKVLGNVSSGTGTDIHRISLAFGQVKVAGKLMGTELRQFVDAGVPLIEYLGKVMGKPAESIRSMTEAGQIGFAQVVEAFNLMNAKGGQFAGLMDVISKTTIGGRWQAFKETLDVSSRNFALMAAEGLGLKDALAGAADSLQDMNKASGGDGVRSFFDGVRTAVNGVWMVMKKVGEAIQYVYRQVADWVKENKVLVRDVLLLVGTVWTLNVAVRAVLTSILLMRSILFTVYALTGIMSLVTSFLALKTLIVTIVTSAVSFGVAIAPISLVLGIIAGLLGRMDAFKFNGSAFSQGLEALQEMKKVFQGIVDALQNGDFQSAWELIIAGFLYAWRVMSLTIKSEWSALMKGLAEGANLYVKAMFTWTSPENIKKGEAAQRKLMQDQMRVADTASFYGLSEANANDLNTYQDIAAQALAAYQAKKKIYDELPKNANITEKVYKEMLEFWEQRHRADEKMAEIIARSTGAQNALQAERDKIANLGEFATDPILQQRKREIDRLLKQVAQNAYDSWYNALYDEFVGEPIDFAKMNVPLGISAKAREVMNDLDKELMKGVTSFDHFTMQMKALREARFGNQAMQNAAGAAIGGFAMIGGVGPMKNDAFRFGLFQQFEAARKNVGDQETRLPPSALRGSTEAQNVINANLSRQTSIEEEVLSVLIANKTLHEQSVIYQKAVADAMEKFQKDPKKIGLFGFDN